MKIGGWSCLVGLLVFSIFSNFALWILCWSGFIRKPRNYETQAESQTMYRPHKDTPQDGRHKVQSIKGTLYRQRQETTRNTKDRLPPKHEKQNIKGALYSYQRIREAKDHKRSTVRSSYREPIVAADAVSLYRTLGVGEEHEKASKPNHNISMKKTARSRSNPKVKPKRSSKKRKYVSSFIPKVVCGNTSDLTDIDNFVTSQRPQVDLFIAIITAPHQLSRRNAIRQTWLSRAKFNPSVAYRFFTDGKGLPSEMERTNLLKERNEFKDLEFLPTTGGYWFSHRLLHAIFWVYERFDFKFFLRMDDDYFVCLNNLLGNLQHRKDDKFLYWGWMHCSVPKQIRMDEGFLILGADLVREIAQRNKSLCCHPFGDQMVAMWVNRLEQEGVNVTYFADNDRVVHRRKHLKNSTANLCENIIGIHQAYPELMVKYWNISKLYKPSSGFYKNVGIKKYGDYCKYPKGLDWRAFSRTFWGYEPKTCWEPGVSWPELAGQLYHVGREKT